MEKKKLYDISGVDSLEETLIGGNPSGLLNFNRTRQCPNCLKHKEEKDFYKSKKNKQCKECIKEKAALYRAVNNKKITEYRESNREYLSRSTRSSNIKKNYGISKEKYYEIMDSAKECEICGSNEKLVYDHDHETMKFRGILCSSCNLGLGKLGDTLNSVKNTLKYMEKHYGVE